MWPTVPVPEPLPPELAKKPKTLRDEFAGLAMQAILSQGEERIDKRFPPDGRSVAECISSNAYYMADAMLAEREKGKGEL